MINDLLSCVEKDPKFRLDTIALMNGQFAGNFERFQAQSFSLKNIFRSKSLLIATDCIYSLSARRLTFDNLHARLAFLYKMNSEDPERVATLGLKLNSLKGF
jgi:hypothetical protein